MDSGLAEQQILAELRDGRANGRPGPHLVNLCIALESGLPLSSEELARVIHEGAQIDPGVSSAASLPQDAVGLAIYSADGTLAVSNPLFHRCVADVETSQPLAQLRARAHSRGRSVGLIPAAEGGLVCVLAITLALGGRWPILQPLMGAAEVDPAGTAVIVLSPSRSDAAFARTASAAGLSALETRLTQALLKVSTLEDAAATLGVKRETAKTAMANAARRVGVNSCAELVGLLVDASCASVPQKESKTDAMKRLFGLTATEARVAAAMLAERSLKHTALALALAPETVKAHQRAIFTKTQTRRSRNFRRLAVEALALEALTPVAELLEEEPLQAHGLRLLFRPDGRRVAFVDYGPKRAPPLFVGHGDFTGRILPAGLVHALWARGFRPIVLQRPGFGLTTRAEEAFLPAAASDMAFVLDSLKADVGHLLMREGGAAAAIAFAEQCPHRLGQALLQNPRQPNAFQVRGVNPLGSFQRFLREQPELLKPVSQMLHRQSSAEAIKATLRHIGGAVPADSALMADDRVIDFLVSDIHGLMSAAGGGFEDERRVYSAGWVPGSRPVGGQWTLFTSSSLFPDFDLRPWTELPGMRFAAIAGGGSFVQFTHPAEIASFLSPI